MAEEKYRFILNGTIIQDTPEGWADIQLTIERDMELNSQILRFTSDLTFLGDGYTLIKAEYEKNYTNNISVEVQRFEDDTIDYEAIFTGTLLLPDVKFNLDKHTVTTSLEDTSFFAAINNRKNLKAILDSQFTINGENITPTPFFDMDFFRPSNGNFIGSLSNRNVYLVKDALDFLVRFMTDNEVKGVESTYLTTASNFNNGFLYLLTGLELRLQDQDAPDISFRDLFTNMRKTHDIGFDFITKSNGDTVMRIEEEEFFFDQDESLTIRNIKDLGLRVDKNRLFSHLEVGNQTSAEESFPFNIRFFVFIEEQYGIQGKGVIDRVLDLKTDFISDSNVFEDIIQNNNDEFDDDILIVQGQTDAIRSLIFGSAAPFYYNDAFINNNILARHINGVPNSIVKYLTASNTPCKIGLLSDNIIFSSGLPNNILTTIIQRVPLNNEASPFYDIGGNYFSVPDGQGLSFYYNVPFEAAFTFEYDIALKIEANTSAPLSVRIRLQRFTPNFVFLEEKTETLNVTIQGTPFTPSQLFDTTGALIPDSIIRFNTSKKFNLEAGDRVAIKIDAISNAIQPGTFDFTMLVSENDNFTCLGSDSDGGVFEEFDPLSYRAQVYRFEKNVSLSDIESLIANSKKKLRINEGSDPALDRSAWIRNVSYDVETSLGTFELIT